jgi:hypothetical protein
LSRKLLEASQHFGIISYHDMASTAVSDQDESSIQSDALMGSGADVWADEPSHPPAKATAAGIGELPTREFDEFDPFKPESQAEDKDDAPDTPAKRAPPPPIKEYEASPASAIHDLAISTPTKSKNQIDSIAAPPMTPTASGSGLQNPLASIASAFRRSSATGSGSRPQTPTGKAAPAILIRDKDETTDIDESEKSAPPAFPSQTGGSNSDGEDGDTPPFDFNLFLEQMRSRAADPIARYLRSFLKEFTKRQWSVGEQIRVINDFLDVWRVISQAIHAYKVADTALPSLFRSKCARMRCGKAAARKSLTMQWKPWRNWL